MKKYIIIFGIIFVLSTAAMIYIQIEYGKDYVNPVVSETLELEPVNYIAVNLLSLDADISVHSGEKIIVEYINDSHLAVFQDENRIEITQNEASIISFFSTKQFQYNVNIKMPNKYYREVKINNKNSNTNLNGVVSGSIIMSSLTGGINLTGANSLLNISTDSGSVYVEMFDLLNNAVITSGSGNVTAVIPENLPFSFEYKTVSGRLMSDYFAEYLNVNGGYKHEDLLSPYSLKVTTKSGGMELLRKE